MQVNALALSLVVHPISFVNIATRMNKPSLAIGHVIVKDSFINRSVSPDLFSSATFFVILPLAVVYDSVFVLLRLLPFVLEIGSELKRAIFFVDLSNFLWTLLREFVRCQFSKRAWLGDKKHIGIGSMRNVFASLTVSHRLFKIKLKKSLVYFAFYQIK